MCGSASYIKNTHKRNFFENCQEYWSYRIHRIARLLPQSIKLSVYYALVYPYLSYCNLIWAINYPTRLKRLVYLQKRIIRLIAGVRKWEHSSPYSIKFKVLSIDQIRDFQIGEFFFRLEHHLL